MLLEHSINGSSYD
uniref:Uncharacterized protein n=1 Tax=Rhizophora mucronata TaxID=61149 RepID=A0A2P2N5R5_RHIMU